MAMDGVILITAIVALVAAMLGFHRIEEGHVGVYWRGGKLLDGTAEPGLHSMVPILDHVESVQVTMQADSVTNIPCGTSGGVMVYFDRIEVVNQLKADHVLNTIRRFGVNYDKIWIFDKIHHEINQFCSRHSLREVFIDLFDSLDESLAKALQTDCTKYDTGIEIITVRVTKPRIPNSVRENYELIEAEKAKLFLAIERQKVVEKDAETEANRARINAEKEMMVRKIEIEKEILNREGVKKVALIDDEIAVSRQKAQADAAFYTAQKQAEADKMRLTPEFLTQLFIQGISNNTKIYFGDKIPSMLADISLLSPDVLEGLVSKVRK
jgi:regulator of protease activity HflC (stomatin/prohibitin superfamily)